eukprot:4392259-Prymnesium_polylepis.1
MGTDHASACILPSQHDTFCVAPYHEGPRCNPSPGGSQPHRGDPFRMPPSDLVVVGCAITGLTSASLFSKEKADVIMIEKSSRVGGVWSHYANPYSRVQTSEP